MPAAQVHAVVSPTKTITIGGHFFAKEMLEDALNVQLLESAAGQVSTRDEVF
jgi:predicted DNA-binding protein with PD1-like motif